MKARRWLAGAALALGVTGLCDGLILALGDDGNQAHAAGRDATGRPIVEIELKAPTRKPELPPTATEPTVAGATAFVRYYFDALNYSLAHGDTDLLAHHSNAGCGLCSGYLLAISKWQAQGAHLTGGLTVPAGLAIGPFSTTEAVPFVATFLTSPASLRQPDGSVADYPGGRTRGGVAVLYANGRWQMTAIVLDASVDASKAKETTP